MSLIKEQKAELAIQIAESRKKVLTEFTKSQRTKGLEAELAKAQSQERATKSEWEIQKAPPGEAREGRVSRIASY